MKLKAALVGVVLANAGCGGNPAQTQVRIVIQSDLGASDPIRELRVVPASTPFARELIREDPPVPFFLAVTPDSQARPFGVRVLLSTAPSSPNLLVVRGAHDVPFVVGEGRMLVLPLPGKCACHGTVCPPAGDPACEDLVAPAVTALDDVTAATQPDGFIALATGAL